MNQPLDIIIVGGVAGGASAAARLRRLDEFANIIMIERGPHVSFANCGLPYYLGGDIQEREKLLVQSPESLHQKFNIDVRVLQEVMSINPDKQTVKIKNLKDDITYELPYDHLILSPGAAPIKPPLEGIELPGIFTLRNIVDMDAIDSWINQQAVKNVVVGGGGYIGLEVAEQLKHRGLNVSIVEGGPQVMGPLDADMAGYIHQELKNNGIKLHLNAFLQSFNASEFGHVSSVSLSTGEKIETDLVVLGLGVKPEVHLAKEAGLVLGDAGGIKVNDFLQTNIPNIWAIGDAIEVMNPLTKKQGLVALAGPANRQGRIVADNIAGQKRQYKGTYGTAILRVFDLAIGMCGLTEKQCKKDNQSYEVIYLHPASHAGYFPGAERMAIKILFCPDSEKLLGFQIIGKDGVDKRTDVLATAIQAGLILDDIAELELAYAPPFGSAKDPVNLSGMIATNIINDYLAQIQWHEINDLPVKSFTLLDVRDSDETEQGIIPGAIVVSLPSLRDKIMTLPKDKLVVTYCASGQRSYYASRILKQHGFRVKNLSGAYKTWQINQIVEPGEMPTLA